MRARRAQVMRTPLGIHEGAELLTYIDMCRAPDLSSLSTPVFGNYALNLSFAGCGTSDPKANSFVVNYILAVDKAIREYNAARNLMVAYASSANVTTTLVESLGRFETCINCTKRALRHIERLARYPEGPAVERTVRRLLDNYGNSITPLRDAIEHIDERIQNGGVADGDPRALFVSPDATRLEIADHRLEFDKLASLLTRMREVAEELARYKEQVDASP